LTGVQVLALRAASAADRELIWQVQSAAMRRTVEATWGWDAQDQRARFDAAFDPELRQIITLDGVAIGGLKIDASGSPLRLLQVHLLPEHQRKGYGTRIVRAVIAQTQDRPVWLEVRKVNPAKALYERLGFRVVGERESHWQMQHDRQT